MKHMERERAMAAWEFARSDDARRLDRNGRTGERKEFVNACKKTASRTLNAGLLPALRILKDKRDQEKLLAKALEGELEPSIGDSNRAGILSYVPNSPDGEPNTLLDRLVHADPLLLGRATEEVLAFLPWLARFVEAPDEESDRASEDAAPSDGEA